MSRRVPKYRRDSRGQAFVEHRSIPNASRRLYLGRHGTDESIARYRKFLARLHGEAVAVPIDPRGLNEIDILIDAYATYAERRYRRLDGEISSEYTSMLCALRPLAELYGDTLAADFGPRCLASIRSHLVKLGRTRTGINDQLSRIKKFFAWCCESELAPPELYHKLLCVKGLYAGQEGVAEAEPTRPASLDAAKAVLPFVAPTVAAMIRTQFYCGMRPGEVCIMRPCDIDRSGDIWIYTPQRHKTAWRGFSQFKAVPSVAQSIIEPLLEREPTAYLFDPRDAAAWANEQRIVNRKPRRTRRTPGEARRVEREKQLAKRRVKKREPGQHYTTASYRRAIVRGFEKAARSGIVVESFSPKQLRNAVVDEVSRLLGYQQASRWAGHEDLNTTNIYTGLRAAELTEVARKLDLIECFASSLS